MVNKRKKKKAPTKSEMWQSSSSRSSNSPNTSSTSSSSSSIKAPPLPFSMQQKSSSSLEDVWKDIRLFNASSSSSSKSKDTNLNTTTSSPLIFQDFLGKDSLMKSTTRCVPPPSPFPADTFLSLTPVSHPCFATLFKDKQHHHHQPPLLRSPSLSDSGFCSSSGGGGVKRDMDPGSDSAAGDHRHKRMIKNRESACRSRARKQAYTNDLEIAVSNLKKENVILKEQLNQFHSAAAAQQHAKKNPLKRTFTAPF